MKYRGVRPCCLALWLAWTGANLSAAIVINEIHYDPPHRTLPEEFIELHNAGTETIDLGGWRLDDAVRFQLPPDQRIPPGGFMVVAEEPAAFQRRFGFAAHGPWFGSLRNEGERVRLIDNEGVAADEVSYATGFPWPTAARGAGSSLELIHPGLDNSNGGAWRSSMSNGASAEGMSPIGPPTPGATNSTYSARTPAILLDVRHDPDQPRTGEPVTILVLPGEVGGASSVRLEYQVVDPGLYIRRSDPAYLTEWTPLALHDDGAVSDRIAGDGAYTAVVPGSLQVHRRLVRYRIRVEGADGSLIHAPYSDDDCPNFAWFVYDGVPAWQGANRPGVSGRDGDVRVFRTNLFTTLPAYHLLARESDVQRSQYQSAYDGVRMWGTLVYDGRVYDHIQFHNRGEASTYVSGKNKWRFHFNRGREFAARDAWNRPYGQTWEVLNLNPCSSPWAAVHRGMAGVDEAISYRVYQLLGVPASSTHPVHFRVIDSRYEASPITQYDGDAWGLYLAVEQPDGAFLDERHLPDGNIYKLEGVLDRKHQGATQVTNNSDIVNFASQSERPQTEAWWRTHLDLPTFYSFHAGNRVVGNVDLRENWNHYLYHHPAGRWFTLPWDLDMQFIPMTHWSGTITQNRCLQLPVLRREFRNRAREVLDLLLSDARVHGGQIAQLIDEYARMVSPPGHELTWAELDQFLWNWSPRTPGDGTARGQTNHRGNFFRTPFTDQRIGGQWVRHLPSPDFNGFLAYILDYCTDTFTGAVWSPTNGDPQGYAYAYLEREATDPDVPERPRITFLGASGFPLHDLRFAASSFADPQGPETFGAVAWRIAEIAAPGVAGYREGEPRRYEIETLWTSGERPHDTMAIRIPVAELRPGHTYRVRARFMDASGRASHWSEPIEFVAAPPDVTSWHRDLRVSEVMYHPPPPSLTEAAAGFDAEDFEFVEFHNSGVDLVSLADLRLTDGVTCPFDNTAVIAPGDYVVVVKNPEAFVLRYGTNAIRVGTFDANLANDGERVAISFSHEAVLHAFTYDDRSPWPASADGEGASLERIHLSEPDHDDAGRWRASTVPMGTPGQPRRLRYGTWSLGQPHLEDPEADPDGDGRPNWAEFALGTEPMVHHADPALRPVSRMASDGELLVEFRRVPAAEGVNAALEGSTDLVAWERTGERISSRPGPNESEWETHRVPLNTGTNARLFLRLRLDRLD
jgi:hypothetical protein